MIATTHQALAALASSLGHRLEDVAHIEVHPNHIIVTHVLRGPDGVVEYRAGFPRTVAEYHQWKRDES